MIIMMPTRSEIKTIRKGISPVLRIAAASMCLFFECSMVNPSTLFELDLPFKSSEPLDFPNGNLVAASN